jgi:septal ring factor EnvC (AmiA/AmiB activator)
MSKWTRTFTFKGKELYYNRIKFNNPTERAVEISIAFDFIANLTNPQKILEIGNVLSHYENSLSENIGIRSRRIVDKFEVDLGVENQDLMSLPSAEKYDAIVSISSVEHVGQGDDPSGGYGEQIEYRDLEGPLKAIAKIYDLLAIDGKALITVPFGKLTDAEWYIQFSQEYLDVLWKKYGIPKDAISANYLKLIDRETVDENHYMLWKEVNALEVSDSEYGWPWSQANAIAVIELTKVSSEFNLNLNLEPTDVYYNMTYEQRREFENCKAQLHQIQKELAQSQSQLYQTQAELEQSLTELNQSQKELEVVQSQFYPLQGEFELAQAQLYKTQEECAQFQSQLYQAQEELEKVHPQLHQTRSELEISESQLYKTQGELELTEAQLYQTQEERDRFESQMYQAQEDCELIQIQLHQIQGELELLQAKYHQTQQELELSQSEHHQTRQEWEQSQSQLDSIRQELEQSQSQLHSTQQELELSQAAHYQAQQELEQSQSQLLSTRQELELSQAEHHQTRKKLEQSQSQLLSTRQELEESQSQLHKTAGQLERWRFQENAVKNPDENNPVQYGVLVWEAWYAYRNHDRAGMSHSLQKSLNCTPFSPTETIVNWLENFGRFSLEKGEYLDTNSLSNSLEWKELMRRVLAVKTRVGRI